MLEHGGRLRRAAREHGIPLEDWLDLSTGIAPWPWPVPPIPATAWHRLPEDDDGLLDAARGYYGSPHLLPVAGSQAAIQALPASRGPSRVGVLAPGYAEHAQAWRRHGHAVTLASGQALLGDVDAFDVLVLIHPNNPGGDTFDVAALRDAAGRLAARGGWLLVDEAFMDATPEASLVQDEAVDGLVVLRSVGKFFGMAGARAGFVHAAPALLERLREQLGPWALSGPARHALALALRDTDWQAAQRERLYAAATRLREVLSTHGLVPTAGTAFFQWRCDARAADLHAALARRGVLTRLFRTPSSLRFGLPMDDAQFGRLDDALRAITRPATTPAIALPQPEARQAVVGDARDPDRDAEAHARRGSTDAPNPPVPRPGAVASARPDVRRPRERATGPTPEHAARHAPAGASSRARVLMVQGCTSDAGKSTLVAALCRWAKRRGVDVAPFKPQNMALNSAVTIDGGEIGRAQAVQAQAAGLAPHTDFNPVLLKPTTDRGAQVIIHGRAIGTMDARHYHDYKRIAMEAVLASHARLSAAHELVLVEGAGSPAEINLRDRDIANMGFAEAVDCPVLLVADIDRGGVFAHIVGTLAVLSESERARIRGFVINRFRGDIGLLQPGLDWLERETGKPVLGVLPYLHGLHLEAEDAVARENAAPAARQLRVVVPVLPRISNHTDFDALRAHPQVDLRFVALADAPPPCDLVVLPGSKSTRADLAALRAHGWDRHLARHLRYGGRVLGICGGLQMLGRAVHDPQGVEGAAGSTDALGWLDLETVLEPDKQLRNVCGRLEGSDAPVTGYEIHCGVSTGPALDRPFARLDDGRRDGARSRDGQVAGTYLHGVFDQSDALAALLAWAGLPDAAPQDMQALREASLERLADIVDAHLDTAALLRLVGAGGDACAA